MPSKLTRRASSTYVGLVQSAAHSLALHYFCSRIYRNQTWILQLGSVRLQNVCHSSPTVDSFTMPVIVGTPQLGWYWTFPSLGESVQPCVICYTGYLCIYGGASRSKSVACPQLCQQASTDIFTGDLQFSQRRCTSTTTLLYWPRRPGRAARQHWQIQLVRFSVSGPNQWNKLPPHIWKVSDKPEQFARALKTFYFQTALTSTSEDNIKRRAIAKTSTSKYW